MLCVTLFMVVVVVVVVVVVARPSQLLKQLSKLKWLCLVCDHHQQPVHTGCAPPVSLLQPSTSVLVWCWSSLLFYRLVRLTCHHRPRA